MPSATVIDLEHMDYRECLSLQYMVHSAVVEGRMGDCLLLVEHPHVFTLGKNGSRDNILVNNDILEQKGIDCISIERGGDVTYHGPGQLVGYPIFSLKKRYGVAEFIFLLEEVMIQVLNEFDIKGERNDLNRGVWTRLQKPELRKPELHKIDLNKIGFVGIAVRKGVVLHGLSLNISPDLSFFKMINSCGLKDTTVTSMEKVLNSQLNISEVKKSVVKHFQDVFGIETRAISYKELQNDTKE